jgi:hypothetical protein
MKKTPLLKLYTKTAIVLFIITIIGHNSITSATDLLYLTLGALFLLLFTLFIYKKLT